MKIKLQVNQQMGKVMVTLLSPLSICCVPCCVTDFIYSLYTIACFLFQAAYGGYIYSYAVKGPTKFHKSDAAYLNALFWVSFNTTMTKCTEKVPIYGRTHM